MNQTDRNNWKVILPGGAGLVGQNLVHRLKAMGYSRQRGVCQGRYLSEMESGVGWGWKVDIRDEALLSRT